MSRSAREQARALVATEVAFIALTAAAAFGFCRLFIGWSFLPPLLLAAAGSHLLAAACRRRGWNVVFALVALLIASQTYTLFGDPLPADEGGVNKMALTHILPGFYFWISSIVISVVGGILCRSRR